MEHAAEFDGSPVRLSPSSRRQAAAAACGAAAGAAVAVFVDPAVILASAVLGAAMAAVAFEDALRFRVPDPWVFGALASGLVWSVSARLRAGDGLVAAGGLAVLSVVVCGGAFLALREGYFRLRGSDGLGLGDVKLAAAGGAWLGAEAFAFAVLVAAAGALAFVAVRFLRGGALTASGRLAFGAFLAPAIWAAWIVAQTVGEG